MGNGLCPGFLLGDRLAVGTILGARLGGEGSGEGEGVDGRMVGLIVGLRLGRGDLATLGFEDVMLCGDGLS